MPHPNTPQATLTTIASFPEKYFLENLAVRADHSILVTAMNHNELWYVPPPTGKLPVEPLKIHTFSLPTLCIVEVEPDIFYIATRRHLYDA